MHVKPAHGNDVFTNGSINLSITSVLYIAPNETPNISGGRRLDHIVKAKIIRRIQCRPGHTNGVSLLTLPTGLWGIHAMRVGYLNYTRARYRTPLVGSA